MADVSKTSTAPIQPAPAKENINSTRPEDPRKEDALKQPHDFQLSGAREDRYDLTYPGSVPPEVDAVDTDQSPSGVGGDGLATPQSAFTDAAPARSADGPEEGSYSSSSDATASTQPEAGASAPSGMPGGSYTMTGRQSLNLATPAAAEAGDARPASFGSVSAQGFDGSGEPALQETAPSPESPPPPAAPVEPQPDAPVNAAPTGIEADLCVTPENSEGGTVVGRLTTTDQDDAGGHSYEIVGGHPLFEIDGDTIKVKEGAEIDYETKSSYDLELRSTDSAGNSIVKIVTIQIGDVNEAPEATPIGDQTALAGQGYSLNTSGHFSDVDQGDTLTYSINGPPWLSIDPHTGVISGTPPAQLAYQEIVGSDGSYDVPSSGVLQVDIKVISSMAGYKNSVGFYVADAGGKPLGGVVVEDNAKQAGDTSTVVDLSDYPGAAKLGFFIIPNGDQNAALNDGQLVEFKLVNGQWQAFADGVGLKGTGANIYFSNPELNADKLDHLVDNGVAGNHNWEDSFKGGDRDYNDVNTDVSVKLVIAQPEMAHVHVPVTVTVSDSGGLKAHSSFELNVQPSTVTMEDIENHTYPPGDTGIQAGPTAILLDKNTVAENSAAGVVVGNLSSTDANASDNHSYEIVGGSDQFEIDGDVIKVKEGAQLDFEGQKSYNLNVRSTDEAGNSLVKTVTVKVTDVNESPTATAIGDQTALPGSAFTHSTASHFADVDKGDTLTYSMQGPPWLSIDSKTGVISGTPPAHLVLQDIAADTDGNYAVAGGSIVEISMETFANGAGYHNSFGYYIADASGNPIGGAVMENNVKSIGEKTALVDLSDYPGAASVGFFIIPDGANKNASLGDGQQVEFKMVSGKWAAYANGAKLNGEGAGVYFTDPSLNPGQFDHMVDNSKTGNQNWEDLLNGGDKSFNDANLQVSVKSVEAVPDADEAHVTVIATDKGGLSAQTSFTVAVPPITPTMEQLGSQIFQPAEHCASVHGTQGNDQISGLSGNDIIYAAGGDDVVHGGEGNDWIDGGSGNDTLHGGNGDDTIYGGNGDDGLYGDAGNDTLHGGDGNDTLHGGLGDDMLFGGSGDDVLIGDQGNDVMMGEDGPDLFLFGSNSGMDTAHGGTGGGWIDTIKLTGAGGTGSAGAYGADWTMTLTSGHVVSQDEHSFTLSNDTSGTITFDQDNQLTFTGMERIEC